MELYDDVYWGVFPYVMKVERLFAHPCVISKAEYFQLREEGRYLQKRCREDNNPSSRALCIICEKKMCQLAFAMNNQQVFLLEGAHTLLSLIF